MPSLNNKKREKEKVHVTIRSIQEVPVCKRQNSHTPNSKSARRKWRPNTISDSIQILQHLLGRRLFVVHARKAATAVANRRRVVAKANGRHRAPNCQQTTAKHQRFSGPPANGLASPTKRSANNRPASSANTWSVSVRVCGSRRSGADRRTQKKTKPNKCGFGSDQLADTTARCHSSMAYAHNSLPPVSYHRREGGRGGECARHLAVEF